LTPERRRAYQNARNAARRAAAKAAAGAAAGEEELTWTGSPAGGTYTVHRVSCPTLAAAAFIGGEVHWKASRRLCSVCSPTMSAAEKLVVRFAQPPATSKSSAVVENEAGALVVAERRIRAQWGWPRRGERFCYANVEHLFPAQSAEDAYFAQLGEED